MSMKKIYFLLILFLAAACGSDDGSVAPPNGSDDDPIDEPDDTPVLANMTINSSHGERLDITDGNTTVLTVTGFDESGGVLEISTTLDWSASNDNVSVDQDGLVTAQAEGTSTVTVETEGIEATFDLTITDIFSQDYHIYVSDAGNFNNPPWQILRYDQNGENVKVFTTQNLGWPQDILFHPDGEVVLISNLNTNRISRHNEETGAYIDDFANDISGPTRMKIGSDNLLYALQWSGNGFVKRYELDGTFVDDFTNVAISQSIGLDWDANGNLYVSSFNGASVRRFDPDGADLGLFIDSGLQGPTNIWFDDEGFLMVNDWTAGSIKRFDSDGNLVSTFASGLSQPEGVAYLPDGNFLVGNGGNGSIKLFSPSTGFVEDFIVSGDEDLLTPNAVTVKELN